MTDNWSVITHYYYTSIRTMYGQTVARFLQKRKNDRLANDCAHLPPPLLLLLLPRHRVPGLGPLALQRRQRPGLRSLSAELVLQGGQEVVVLL